MGPEGYAQKLSTEQRQSHAIFERGVHDALPHAKAQVAREVYIRTSFAAERSMPHEDGQRTAIERVKIRMIYSNVHSPRRLNTDRKLYCGICRATASVYCHCGAFLVAPVALRAFIDFVKSPRNPILNYCDPADQEGIQ